MADLKTGKLTQIIGAVLDIKFPEGGLPEINDAVNVPLEDGKKLVVEVAQHLGDDTVRCIAIGPPVASAVMPRFSPSVGPMAIQRTVSSPRCCATSTMQLMCHWKMAKSW